MATVGVALTGLDYRAETVAVPKSVPAASEKLTSGATSVASTISVPTDRNGQLFWLITASDAAVWVKFGTTPVASAGSSYLVPAGQSLPFSAGADGEKCAVINA